jgi:hypothetical protein
MAKSAGTEQWNAATAAENSCRGGALGEKKRNTAIYAGSPFH